jgi:hypothetical protein
MGLKIRSNARWLLRLTALIGLLYLLPVQAQTQLCLPIIPATTPSNHFTVHDNGTVSDNETGLMWKICAEGQAGKDCKLGSPAAYSWQAALKQAQTVNATGGYAGYTDWRLPKIKELFSIVERQCSEPSINLAVFPETPSAMFWSSSPIPVSDGNDAWAVLFVDGFDYWYGKDYQVQVRLVRGGQ